MAETNPLDRLSYVLHLLEDIKHFHHTNAHSCSCEICCKKTSLMRSSITTAIDEVKDISSSLLASSFSKPVQNLPLHEHNATNLRSPQSCLNTNDVISYAPTSTTSKSTGGSKPTLNVPNAEKQTSPIRVQESGQLAPPGHSNICSSLLSSTQRDSGVHSDNFLHYNSISPIKSLGFQDTSSDSSDSDKVNTRPNHQRLSASHQVDPHRKVAKSPKIQGEIDSPHSVVTPSINPDTVPRDLSEKQTTASPIILLPHHLPIEHPQLGQLYPYTWLPPQQGPRFSAPATVNIPQFLSTQTTTGAGTKSDDDILRPQDSPFCILSPGVVTATGSHNYSLVNSPYQTWNYHMPISHSQVDKKHSVPSSQQVFESKATSTEDRISEHKFFQNDGRISQSSLPQIHIENISMSSNTTTATDPLLRKDVMLNDGSTSPDNGMVKIDISLNGNVSFRNSDTSDLNLNAKDVSGIVWRPWEAKEDVYKIISDLSIEEEDSMEIKLAQKGNSPPQEHLKKSGSAFQVEEDTSFNDIIEQQLVPNEKENVFIKEKVNAEDIVGTVGLFSCNLCCSLGEIFESSLKIDSEDIENHRSHLIVSPTPPPTPTPPSSPTKNSNLLSQSLNNGKSEKRNKGRPNKTRSSKENCDKLNDISPTIGSVRQTKSSTSLQDISNTMKPRKFKEEKFVEGKNLVDDIICNNVKLNVDNLLPNLAEEKSLKKPKSFVKVPDSSSKVSGDCEEPHMGNSLNKADNVLAQVWNNTKIDNVVNSVEPSAKNVKHIVSSVSNSSLQVEGSSEKAVMKKLNKSQSEASVLGMGKDALKFKDKVVTGQTPHKESQGYDVDRPSSENNFQKPIAQAPRWGAPALVECSKAHTTDPPNDEDISKKVILREEKDSIESLVANENGRSDTNTDFGTCRNKRKASSQVITERFDPIEDGEEEIKSTLGRHLNFSLKDQRSRVTALCHDLLQMRLDRDNDLINRSLPVSKVHKFLRDKAKSDAEDLGCVSFEANQSFPKMGRQLKDVASYWTYGAKNHDVLDWCHSSTPTKSDVDVVVVTPRNRRSIFGLSPPELSSNLPATLLSSDGGKENKEECQPLVQSESSSCSSQGEDEHLTHSNLEYVWESLDLSESFPRLPGLREILFNCVTGSICLIDPLRKGKIISVNESFQYLIGLHEKVVGQRLFRFIKIRHSVENLPVTVPHKIIFSDGRLSIVCGKLVSCIVATGEEMPVSIWTVRLQSNPELVACMIGMTPSVPENLYVNRDMDFIQVKDAKMPEQLSLTPCLGSVLTGLMVVQPDGTISDFDYPFFHLHLEHSNLEKVHISGLLTHILRTSEDDEDENVKRNCHNTSVEMYQYLTSGLGDVTRLVDGEPGQPRRGLEPDYLILPVSCFAAGEQVENISHLNDSDSINKFDQSDPNKTDYGADDSIGTENLSAIYSLPQTSTPCKQGRLELHKPLPANNDTMKFTTGIYAASFLCGNDSYIDVCLKMSYIRTASGERLFCVWVYIQQDESSLESDTCEEDSDEEEESSEEEGSQTQEEEGLEKKTLKNPCNNLKEREGMTNSSLGQMVTEIAVMNHSHNAPRDDVMDLEQGIKGSFAELYFTLETLGQGSFGFVRRAKQISGEHKSVVVKFIRKRCMFDDSWVQEGDVLLPMEVIILRSLDNEHIVKVLDVHQNEDFVQMVMEDFGDLDLFDFIDQVNIDESLACFIFRQIISGVEYLHSCKILHRDIKDENVIINSSFQCKLIDFGSAAYMLPEGELFQKFRGTLEYCSPEVHLGKGYHGPELDAWALGVTLYTMVFKENPYTAESLPFQMTESDFPFPVSNDLSTLLFGLMCCDPSKRYSVFKGLGSDWLRQIVDMSLYKWEDLLGSAEDYNESRV